MTTVSIIGAGTMAGVLAGAASKAGGSVQIVARELEALGFLQVTLAAAEKTPWTGGFALML